MIIHKDFIDIWSWYDLICKQIYHNKYPIPRVTRAPSYPMRRLNCNYRRPQVVTRSWTLNHVGSRGEWRRQFISERTPQAWTETVVGTICLPYGTTYYAGGSGGPGPPPEGGTSLLTHNVPVRPCYHLRAPLTRVAVATESFEVSCQNFILRYTV